MYYLQSQFNFLLLLFFLPGQPRGRWYPLCCFKCQLAQQNKKAKKQHQHQEWVCVRQCEAKLISNVSSTEDFLRGVKLMKFINVFLLYKIHLSTIYPHTRNWTKTKNGNCIELFRKEKKSKIITYIFYTHTHTYLFSNINECLVFHSWQQLIDLHI